MAEVNATVEKNKFNHIKNRDSRPVVESGRVGNEFHDCH